jgi:hypothetical protein
VRLVQLCFDFYMIEAKPENLIGDRAYDSDPLDEQLRRDGIEMIAPRRSNRSKPATQDGRRFRRYARPSFVFFDGARAAASGTNWTAQVCVAASELCHRPLSFAVAAAALGALWLMAALAASVFD